VDIPRVLVVGIGGGGGNTVGYMWDHDVAADCVVVNTDAASLARNPCPHRVLVAAGDDEATAQALAGPLAGARLVILVSGFGGTTGTTVTPIVARIARDQGAIVVGIIFTPFDFESASRRERARAGLATLRGIADWAAEVPCSHLVEPPAAVSLDWAFDVVSEWLRRWINSLTPPFDAGALESSLRGTPFAEIVRLS